MSNPNQIEIEVPVYKNESSTWVVDGHVKKISPEAASYLLSKVARLVCDSKRRSVQIETELEDLLIEFNVLPDQDK